jgi:hypothetical protein
MVRIIEDLAGDWRRLDERIEGLSDEIEAIARQDAGCERLISVPGIGPIISSAMVAAIGAGDVFSKGRDFAAADQAKELGVNADPKMTPIGINGPRQAIDFVELGSWDP